MVSLYIKEISTVANRILELYRSKYGLKNKDEALEKMIMSHRKEFKEEDISRDWRNDPVTPLQQEFLERLGINSKEVKTKGEATRILNENRDSPKLKGEMNSYERKKEEQKLDTSKKISKKKKGEDLPDY